MAHRGDRRTASTKRPTHLASFQMGSMNMLDQDQETDENSFMSSMRRRSGNGDFIDAIKQSQGDTISARIASVTGSLPGSQGFISAKLAVSKFLKIFPGQEEIGSLTETFQQMTGVVGDKFFHGTLHPNQLQQFVQLKGFDFTDKELQLVFPIIDIDGDGSVDLDEFTHFGMAATITAQRISSGVGANPGTDMYNKAEIAVEKVLRLIPKRVLAYYSGKGELDALKLWLEDIDADGNGSIDEEELRIAMERLSIDMKPNEVGLIFPILDLDGDGSFDLEELTNFVKVATRTMALQQRIAEGTGTTPGTPKFQKSKEAIHKLLKTVPGRAELAELKSVFEMISPDGTGFVSKEALQNSLHRHDCAFTDEETRLVFSVLDLDGDGGVDLLEFTEFVKACSTTNQRIRQGSGFEPGSLGFEQATIAVNKVLSVIPGRDEMSHLVDTFRKIDHDHSGQWSEKELLEAVRLPDFEKRIEEAGLKPMTPTEVGLVFQVLDEQNHRAIDLDTFIEFFKQARTLGITLAFDDAGVKRDDEAGRLRKSQKTQKHAELYEVDVAKQEKEVQLSKLMGRIHNNDRELPIVCLSGLGLKDAHIRSLTSALRHNIFVRSLNLQYNDITDAGAKFLADYLEERSKLVDDQSNLSAINLSANGLTEDGITSLINVSERCHLRSLRFRGNPGWTADMRQSTNSGAPFPSF